MEHHFIKSLALALALGLLAMPGQSVAQDMETEAVHEDLRPDEAGPQAAGKDVEPAPEAKSTSPSDEDPEEGAAEQGMAPSAEE